MCSGAQTNIPKGECDLLQQDCPDKTCVPVGNGAEGAGQGVFCVDVCTPVCCPDCGSDSCNEGPAYKQVDRYSVETEARQVPEERAPEAYFCRLRSTETRPPVSRWCRQNRTDFFVRGP